MTTCPVCEGTQFVPFVSRKHVPVHQNLVLSTREAARRVPRGDLAMMACERCGFVFNSAFDERLLSYGENYDNTQSHSGIFARYLDGLVRELVLAKGVRDCHVVEVGCGKGEFLRRLVGFPESGLRGTGFDPSYLGPATDLGGRVSFQRRFYGPETADTPADVVICRHVIEHIANPVALLRTVRSALSGAEARVFFETPSVEWILNNCVVWDFFFEHCSLFSARSIAAAFETSGFQVNRVDRVFGDQYFWLEAKASAPVQPTWDAEEIPSLARDFARIQNGKISGMTRRLRDLRAEGPVALWGAGAKGTAFANLVDPACELISCLVDINPAKQGHFVPGSGHAIVGPDEIASRGVANAVLMNANYRGEILSLIASSRIVCNLVDLE